MLLVLPQWAVRLGQERASTSDSILQLSCKAPRRPQSGSPAGPCSLPVIPPSSLLRFFFRARERAASRSPCEARPCLDSLVVKGGGCDSCHKAAVAGSSDVVRDTRHGPGRRTSWRRVPPNQLRCLRARQESSASSKHRSVSRDELQFGPTE